MGPGGYLRVGTGIAPLRTHPVPHPGYTPPHATRQQCTREQLVHGRNMVVGLISVEQLSLDGQISGFRGITEVYNLVGIRKLINHFRIPGFE